MAGQDEIAIKRGLYEQSENVTYVWEALADLGPEEPLPAWVRAYLAEVAAEVAALTYQLAPSPGPRFGPPVEARLLTPEQAIEKLPAALRFVRRGRNGNAFSARRQMESDVQLAWRYERALHAKQLGNANELKSAIAEVLSRKDMSSVERRIARGRKIMKVEQSAKKRG
jgi:hypothetical protein